LERASTAMASISCRNSAPTQGDLRTCSRVSIQANIEFLILIHSRLISCS
jgi:hypothetical protein